MEETKMIERDGVFDMDDIMGINTVWKEGYQIPRFILNGDISEIIIRPSGYNLMIVPFVISDNCPYYINVRLKYNNMIDQNTWESFKQLRPMQSVQLECRRSGGENNINLVDLVNIKSVSDETINPVQYCSFCGSFIFTKTYYTTTHCCAGDDSHRHISYIPMKYYETYKV